MRMPKLLTCAIALATLLVAAGCSERDSVVYYQDVPGYGLIPVGAAVDPATGFVTYPRTYSAGTVRYVRGGRRLVAVQPDYGTASLLTNDLTVPAGTAAPAAPVAPVAIAPVPVPAGTVTIAPAAVPVIDGNYRVVYRRGRRARLPRRARQVVGATYAMPAEAATATAIAPEPIAATAATITTTTETVAAADTVAATTSAITAAPVAEPATTVAIAEPAPAAQSVIAGQPVYVGQPVLAQSVQAESFPAQPQLTQPLMQALPTVYAPQAAVVSEPLSALFAYAGISDVDSGALASLCAPGVGLSECFTMNEYQVENTPVALVYPDAEGAVPLPLAQQVAFAAPAPVMVSAPAPVMTAAPVMVPAATPAPTMMAAPAPTQFAVVAAPVPAVVPVPAPAAPAPSAPAMETSKYQALTPPRDFTEQAALPPASAIRPGTPRPEVSMPTPLGSGEIMPPVPATSEIENALDLMLSGEMETPVLK